MVAALSSLLLGRPVRPVVGMTGEVTLQGRVLPIGGVKQKVLAAYRAGLQEVVLPARNGPDLEDVPEEVRSKMAFTLAETVDDVLRVALGRGAGQAHRSCLWLHEVTGFAEDACPSSPSSAKILRSASRTERGGRR